jgi:uncharacterized repeat protein (TIGR01451 family)
MIFGRLFRFWSRRGFVRAVLCGLVASFSTPLIAQISVVFPTPRTVIQRNNANQAQLSVLGLCPPNTTRIEAFLQVIVPGQGTNSPAYLLIDDNPQNGRFRGQIPAQGGWYLLHIRAMQGGTVLASTQVTPVGIGEVFVVAGQSNGQGVIPNRNTVAATADRVVAVPHYNATDTIRLPLPPVFEPVTRDGVIGPRGLTSWCWGVLGDSLTKRLNVPVAFYNTAWSGTAIRNWRESITQDSTATSWGEFFRPKMPYANLKRVLQDYVSLTGLRAVLWHQGEAEYYDVNPQAPNYYNDLRFVIAQSRADVGYADLPWMVARASVDNFTRTLYPSGRYEPVTTQQTQVIQTTNRVFFGPDTDTIDIPRSDGVHLSGTGLVRVANAWSKALTTDFFNAATPLLPQAQAPLVDLALSGYAEKRVGGVGEDLLVTIKLANTGQNPASGIKLRCQLPNNLACVNPGIFTLRNGQLLRTIGGSFTPGGQTTLPFVVRPLAQGTFRIAAEIIRTDQLDEDSRPNTSFADGQDDLVWIEFRTSGASGAVFSSPISVNAVTLPPVAGNQPIPDPSRANLSLALVTDRRAIRPNQPLSVSLVLTNSGGQTASNVQVSCLLPAGMSGFNSPTMNLNGNVVSGSVFSIPVGSSATLTFQVNGPASGTALFKAQVTATTPANAEATPNNGYDNGERDEAQAMIRVW